ncbi:putative negative acting factor [Diaporthe ampelina]|uniref:Putative negative acting factor n=1 Tax=Diaporthe ampelina TaxID=1214573 RepID=A0A0G2H6G1_9PEZI|nr:putative negative acting factor [Diaporthe ampelina]
MGCRTCRARRIKCDETRPVCNQCIKSRRHCSGYRSDFDILHRDETQATAARAKKAAAKKAAKRAAEEGGVVITFDTAPDADKDNGGASSSSSSSSSNNNNSSNKNNSSSNDKNSSTLLGVSSSQSSSPTPSPASSAPAPSSSSTTAGTSPLELSFPAAAPAVPVDQRASHYFAWNFIMVPGQRGSSSSGHLDYLLPLLNSETRPDGAFQLAYSACALAAMGNRFKGDSTDLVELSYMQHSRALVAIHRALKDPAESRRDGTLATVLLLSLFEKITAAKEVGLLAWRTHIEGAMHLVRSRGREMVQNKDSVLLFNAVRLQIIARTLSSGTSSVMGVNWWLPESVAADSIGARYQRFALEVSDLRAEVTRLMATLSRNDQGLELMLEMLRRVQDLDLQMANFLQGLPAQYQLTPLYWEDRVLGDGDVRHAPIYPGRVDAYSDLIVASIWNATRATRIILMSLLIRVAAWICSPADFRSTPEYATAVRTCKANIADIISSVPYMLSMHHKDAQRPSAPAASGFACGTDEQSKMLGGLMVAWPLSTVRTCDYTMDEQREWAIGRLNFIASELGIKYASSLAAAKIRFPSMLIRRDGLMPTKDPLSDIKQTLSTKIPVR